MKKYFFLIIYKILIDCIFLFINYYSTLDSYTKRLIKKYLQMFSVFSFKWLHNTFSIYSFCVYFLRSLYCCVFACVMCAFSLTYPFLHAWSVNLQMPMSERKSRILINLKRTRVTHRRTVVYRSLIVRPWFKRGYVMLEEPYLNRSTRLVSCLHSQPNISNPAVLLQFTLCHGCDRQDQTWVDPRFTTSVQCS